MYAVFAAPEVMRFWNSAPPRDLAEAGEWAAYLADMQRRLGLRAVARGERGGGRLAASPGCSRSTAGRTSSSPMRSCPQPGAAATPRRPAAAALDYAFGEAGLERVVGIAKPENEASVAVLRKLGMRSLGEAEYWGKRWAKYEVAAADWRAEQAAARPPLAHGAARAAPRSRPPTSAAARSSSATPR